MPPLSWNPKLTRVFVTCLAKFEGEAKPAFSTHDRLDPALVQTLQERGVPPGQVTFVQDAAASTANVRAKFVECLRASQPDEQLIFYFGSHGSYNGKEGEFWFSTFDDFLPFEWVFETIEKEFKGSAAMLFPDCCYSGGMVDLLPRSSRVAYAVLSSTHAHNLAWSGWRFIDCLIRGFTGDPRLDREQNGRVNWDELCRFTARQMALVAEGKPMFAASGAFDPRLELATVSKPLSDPQIGQMVEAQWDGEWYNAEILEVRGAEYKIHYTDYTSGSDEWVTMARIRSLSFERFWLGAPVEIQDTSGPKWYPARVLETWENLHFCRYDDYGPEYDEWIGPSRIRRVGSK
jgi:hypothetical protein